MPSTLFSPNWLVFMRRFVQETENCPAASRGGAEAREEVRGRYTSSHAGQSREYYTLSQGIENIHN